MTSTRKLVAFGTALITSAAIPALGAEGFAPSEAATDIAADPAVVALVPAAVTEAGTLRFSVYGNTPYTMTNEQSQLFGTVVDLGAAIANVMGLDAVIEDNGSVAASKVAVESGRYDVGMGPFLDSPSAEDEFNIINWIKVTPGIVFRAGDAYAEPMDFCGRTIAIVSGSVPVERNMEELAAACAEAGLPEQTVESFGDQNATVVAVLSGRADGAMMGSASALYIASAQSDRLDAFSAETDIFGVGLFSGLGISKNRMDLTEAVQAAMQSLLESGSYEAIFATYGIEDLMVDELMINPITSAQQ